MTSNVDEVAGKLFDYVVVVGGGTAGCPLAATLSERFSVLVIERGGSPYGNPLVSNKMHNVLPLIETDEFLSVAQHFVSKDGVPNHGGWVAWWVIRDKRRLMTQSKAAGPPSMKFTWPIKNFRSLYVNKLYSDIFVGGGCKWRILIYPKGSNKRGYLAVYLDVADSATLPKGWSISAQFGLSVVDQVHGKYSIRAETLHRFNASSTSWGYASFMPLTDLYDAAKGFLVNGTVIVEVDGVVTESSSLGFGRDAPPPENDVTGDAVTTSPRTEHLADKTSCQVIESPIAPVTTTNEAIVVPSRTPNPEQLETQSQDNTPRPDADAANPVRPTEDFANVQESSSTSPPKSVVHDFHDPFSEVSELMHLTPQLSTALFVKVLKLCHTLEILTTEGAKGIPGFLQAWEEVCALPYPPNQDGWLKTFAQINSRLSSLRILYSHSSDQLLELETDCASLKATLANSQKIQTEALALAIEERRINDTLSGLREKVHLLQTQITKLESRLGVTKARSAPLADPLKDILIAKSHFACADTLVRHQKKIASSMERNLAEAFQEAIRCLRSYMENPNASPPSSRFADDVIPDL